MGDKTGGLKLDPRLTKKRPAWAVGLVDDFFSKIKGKDTWEVIDHIIRRWAEAFPEEYKEQVSHIKSLQETRRGKHAAFSSKSQRHLLSVPPRVMLAIEKILGKERADFNNKEFVRKFAKRYDVFRVPARGSIGR